MFLEPLHESGLQVRGQTDFHGNPAIVHIGHEIGIFAQARAVTDAMRAAPMNGLMNACRAVSFSSVTRTIHVVVPDDVEGFPVMFGWKILLGSGQIEPHNA